MIYGIASGYYNPLTVAHIQMFEASKWIVDHLIVLINNDAQVKLKGSIPFNTEKDRLKIVRALNCVDEVHLSVDKELTIAKTLEYTFSHYIPVGSTVLFLNGGDRVEPSPLELEACKKYNMITVYGIGGYNKVESSSKLIAQAARKWVKSNENLALAEIYGFK